MKTESWVDEFFCGIKRKCNYLAKNAEPIDVAGAALMCTITRIEEIGHDRDLFTSADTEQIKDLLDIAKVQTEAIADLQKAEEKLERVEKALAAFEDGEDIACGGR